MWKKRNTKSRKEKIASEKRLAKERKFAAEAETVANEDRLNESNSSFKHKQTKYRSLKKADQALPNSPNKRKEIVKNLATKYEIRINLNESTKGRKATLLTNEEEHWIVNALLLFFHVSWKIYHCFLTRLIFQHVFRHCFQSQEYLSLSSL